MRGEVVSVGPEVMRVQLDSAPSCAACPTRDAGCGAISRGLLPSGLATIELSCRNLPGASIGDAVQVTADRSAVRWLPLVAVAYGLPTAGLLAGTLAGHTLGATFGPSLGLGPAMGAAPDAAFGAALESAASAALGAAPAAAPGAALGAALGCAVGLAGGLLAWRLLAPRLTERWASAQCLNSGLSVRALPLS